MILIIRKYFLQFFHNFLRLAVSRHKNVKYCLSHNLRKNEMTPLMESSRPLNNEYVTGIHEVVKRKKTVTDDIAVQIR